MEKTKRIIGSLLLVILLLGMGFAAGYYGYTFIHAPITDQVDYRNSGDIELPFETEKITVTVEEVDSVIKGISEFSTYECTYTVRKSVDESRYILEARIPGTKNTLDITAKGIVKVGFNLDDVAISVDDSSKTIYISLPEAKINDNYIVWDSVECKETNTILNPIHFEQYKKLISELEALGKADVEKKGIYEKAQKRMKDLLDVALSKFEGFDIVFME